MASTKTLLRQIKEKDYPAASNSFKQIMKEKREAAENREFRKFAANLFTPKNS